MMSSAVGQVAEVMTPAFGTSEQQLPQSDKLPKPFGIKHDGKLMAE